MIRATLEPRPAKGQLRDPCQAHETGAVRSTAWISSLHVPRSAAGRDPRCDLIGAARGVAAAPFESAMAREDYDFSFRPEMPVPLPGPRLRLPALLDAARERRRPLTASCCDFLASGAR